MEASLSAVFAQYFWSSVVADAYEKLFCERTALLSLTYLSSGRPTTPMIIYTTHATLLPLGKRYFG